MIKRTQEQRDNLQKLIDGFKSLPDDYRLLDMEIFAESDDEASNATPEHPCGTCMCAAGHGPSFGIPIKETQGWEEYSHLKFSGDINFWCFCFAAQWPNNVPELIARLELAQADNIPDGWTYNDRFAEAV